jgi:predicted O-methyltransferase YrrM
VSTVREHYDTHLGPIYSWMQGDPKAALAAARRELGALGLTVLSSGAARRALDLGSGTGIHAMALAEFGFEVTALDHCEQLLNEARLMVKRAGLDDSIRVCEGELTDFRAAHPGPFAVILCMGDTLTHLADTQAVRQLLRDIAASLEPGGLFAATFRDYSGQPKAGAERFVPVRSDAGRILTCFLETHGDTVTVHDIVHTHLEGGWQMRVSAYEKLRLDPQWLLRAAQDAGLNGTVTTGPRGMMQLTVTRS